MIGGFQCLLVSLRQQHELSEGCALLPGKTKFISSWDLHGNYGIINNGRQSPTV